MPINVHDLQMPSFSSRVETKEGECSRQEFFELSRDIADKSWIARSLLGYGVFRHEDVSAILRDRRWHSAVGLMADLNPYTTQDFKRRRKTSILALDGEAHNRLKRILTPYFSPQIAENLRPFMRKTIIELIDGVAASGKADIAQEISKPYPIRVLCKLLGIPDYDLNKFSEWAVNMLRNFDMNYEVSTETILTSQAEMDEYVESLINERKLHPGDDLISALVATSENGDSLSTEEILTLIEALMIAGIDTTQSQLSTCVLLLMENQYAWEMLSSEEQNSKYIVDELMRLSGAVASTARIASEDVVYKDVLFPKGTILFINMAVANYDERVFSAPESFVHNRHELESKHLSFGMGLHYCLGAPIAKAELQEALVEIAKHLKNIRLNGETKFKFEHSAVYGPISIPVVFDYA